MKQMDFPGAGSATVVFPGRPWLWRLLKISVTLCTLAYIIVKIASEKEKLQHALRLPDAGALVALVAATLLLIVNLGFEAAKWRHLLLRHDGGFGFSRAFQAVLCGIATGIFTPNRIGEYAGRLMYLRPEARTAGAVYTFANRLAQMLPTLWAGMWGLLLLAEKHGPVLAAQAPVSVAAIRGFAWISGLAGCLLLGAMLLLKYTKQLNIRILSRRKLWAELGAAFATLDMASLLWVHGLSCLRYLVFSLQYYLLLRVCGYMGDVSDAFALIAVVFLLKSFLPAFSLAELGVRESVALAVMPLLGVEAFMAVGSAFLLYILNLVVPAIAGLVLLNRMKS
ncbi:MAG: UPF0104 family protein [Bacteroidetes bacterium]|nr:MAG: UPF0104 family protein [Bacteroidota bacterium]